MNIAVVCTLRKHPYIITFKSIDEVGEHMAWLETIGETKRPGENPENQYNVIRQLHDSLDVVLTTDIEAEAHEMVKQSMRKSVDSTKYFIVMSNRINLIDLSGTFKVPEKFHDDILEMIIKNQH